MQHIWYPFTQAKTAPPPLKVKSAHGAWLELDNGQRILDCISSWWVNLHGHSHPAIAAAIYEQAKQLEHVIFAGFTHDPAEQLANLLLQRLPEPLSRVFFSDNGSTAVEVALKMAYQYWHNQRQTRTTFIAFEGAYHGDTVGAMSVGARSLFSEVFSDLLFDVKYVPFPGIHIGDDQVQAREEEALAKLETVLQQGGDRVAAILIEPLVQGVAGMQICRPAFLQQVQQLAHRHGTLLIFDEVMTGFGRTGDWFACLKAGVTPDIICLSKGLTGGSLPLALTVCTEQIYNAFYSDDPMHTFYHGHSYTANPLGCAAAIASWQLMHENEPRFKGMEALHRQHLSDLQDHPRLEKLRVIGTIAAMDIVTDDEPGYLNQISHVIREKAIAAGLFLRPLGEVLYLMPPYCITEDELAFVYSRIKAMI
ncbi:adenosylmethionine--8-amino-7-oxononanoate transaminase [Oscillatoria sp. FACHB-1407]|uniref:adenosylmethionine--8-amino-7-oxononanoate transaminase n=1 Tax=Oscillatoria sp. FACHB-1407 TaxID=2692847 RepID=UPI001686DA68|nr:adenosylmethionine--8-amino-7-oxononanoate transaminase [Oscillatoria sp. FACHB-1407]MBD2462323.1 adenosylmethionine--8-amino-7-oxononanoate transaminase [Oscillatoria sp. FACHB-1407]